MIEGKEIHSVPNMPGYYYDDDMQLYTVCPLKRQGETQCVYRIRIHGVPTKFNLEKYLAQCVDHSVSGENLGHAVSRTNEHSVFKEDDHAVSKEGYGHTVSFNESTNTNVSLDDMDHVFGDCDICDF